MDNLVGEAARLLIASALTANNQQRAEAEPLRREWFGRTQNEALSHIVGRYFAPTWFEVLRFDVYSSPKCLNAFVIASCLSGGQSLVRSWSRRLCVVPNGRPWSSLQWAIQQVSGSKP
jgi:hypothetical protein